MIPTMTDMNTVLSTVNTYVINENKTHFNGSKRLKVEPHKGVGIGGVFSDIPNNFCIFIDTPDNPGPCAVYLYVKLEEGVLKCTLRLSDEIKDFREDRILSPLPMSLNAKEIAGQLIESVMTETKAR